MCNNENVKNKYNKQIKFGKTLCLISDILVPAGLIAILFFYLFCPSVAAILTSPGIVIIGFILDSIGEALQAEAKESLKNYYHNKMINFIALKTVKATEQLDANKNSP